MTPTIPVDPGFTVLPGVLSNEEIANVSAHVSTAALHRSRAGARNVLSDPTISRLANDRRLLRIASGTLGGDSFPFRATLFDKSMRSNWLVVWHQDTALPLETRRDLPGWGPWSIKAGALYAHAPADALSRIVALRVHLDDSTADNGPLRVLPGTHLLGVLTDSQIQHQLRTVSSVECLVARGGILRMQPLLVHSSSKASGLARRRVIHIEYASSRELGDGLELAVTDRLQIPESKY